MKLPVMFNFINKLIIEKGTVIQIVLILPFYIHTTTIYMRTYCYTVVDILIIFVVHVNLQENYC